MAVEGREEDDIESEVRGRTRPAENGRTPPMLIDALPPRGVEPRGLNSFGLIETRSWLDAMCSKSS